MHVNWLSPDQGPHHDRRRAKRTLVWDDLNPHPAHRVFDRGVDLTREQLGADDARRTGLVPPGDMVAPALPEREALRAMVEEFADSSVRAGAPRTDGAAGLRVLDILEAASRSLEFAGSVVPLRSAR